jgi:type IV secretory pathway VirB3-like protein
MQSMQPTNLPTVEATTAPVAIVGIVMIAMGLVIAAAGIALAVYLKKKNK